MRIALVAAVAENGVIGYKGRLPWHLPDDLRWFQEVTMGKPVIMGRLTWESITVRSGKSLKGRDNIVVSSGALTLPEGAYGVRSLEEALARASRLADRAGVDEVVAIGGRRIYEAALPRSGRLYLTEIAASPEGDVYFPPFDRQEWREIMRKARPLSGDNNLPYSFVVLERKEENRDGIVLSD
ncbi:MAG: dihydrofolate reductase [Parvularculales bacterium]